MAAVQITSAVWPTARTARLGPYMDGSGNLWVIANFYTGIIYNPCAFKSTDGGTTWSHTSYSAAPGNSQEMIDSVYDGSDTIYVLWQDAAFSLYITQFTLSTATWTSVAGATSFAVQADVNGRRPAFLARRSDGSFVVTYQGPTANNMGTGYRQMYYVTCTSAGVWGTATLAYGLSGSQVHVDTKCAVLGTSDRVHMLNYNATLLLTAISLSSANALDTAQSTAGGGATSYYTIFFDANLGKLVVDNSITKPSRATSQANTTWTQDSTAFGTDAPASCPTVFVYDNTGSKLYVLYRDSSTADIFVNSAASTTWGTAATQDTATAPVGISAGKITSAIGLVFNDTNVYFDKYSLATGPQTWQGQALGSATLSGSASAAVVYAAQASGSASETATANGGLLIQASASGAVSASASATAKLLVGANASASVSETASASAVATYAASGSGTATGTASASAVAIYSVHTSGSVSLAGTANGGLLESGSANGAAALVASASASVVKTGTTSGTATLTASATCSVVFAISASGSVVGSGSAVGVVTLAGTGSAGATVTGTANGSLVGVDSASGTGSITGASTGSLILAGVADGSASLTGSANGSLAGSTSATGNATITATASAGVLSAGQATSTATSNATASAVVSYGGSSVGSVNGSGAATSSVNYSTTASGTVLLTGSATASIVGAVARGTITLSDAAVSTVATFEDVVTLVKLSEAQLYEVGLTDRTVSYMTLIEAPLNIVTLTDE